MSGRNGMPGQAGVFAVGLFWAASAVAMGSAPARNPAPPSPEGEFILRIMNYNVKGVPVPSYRHFRHRHIGRALRDLRDQGRGAHLLALQEMIAMRTRWIAALTDYPYRDRGPGPDPEEMQVSAGLEILSEFRILEENTAAFPVCAGSDCLARKGVQHVRVELPGAPFPVDVYNTHMNAGGEANSDVRAVQVETLSALIGRTHDPGIPMIVLGDFNFRRTFGEYPQFVNAHAVGNAARQCGLFLVCSGEPDPYAIWRDGLIDHQFFTGGPEPAIAVEPVHYEHYFEDRTVRGVPLSDHPAVMVHYRISWNLR